jgi:protein gp37
MGDNSAIEWTDATWNPVTGCSKVSPGCANCYAERLAPRVFAGQIVVVQEGVGECSYRPRVFTDVRCHEPRLEQPLHWRKPRRIFVNSMSDLFHEDVPDAFIDKVFAVMALAPQHTFQILTKRAERMRGYFVDQKPPIAAIAYQMGEAAYPFGSAEGGLMQWGGIVAEKWTNGTYWPLPNVWLGVSVENQHFANERIPLLLQTPAAVRFISAEPLLGPVDISMWLYRGVIEAKPGDADYDALQWVIVGGESGSGARPFDLAWARSIVQQCQAAGVPVFVKQLGAKPTTPDLTHCRGGAALLPDRSGYALTLRNRKGGDPSEWPEDLRVREFPREPTKNKGVRQ